MSKKKGEGLKSFNRGFNVPDTYIIIFFVVGIVGMIVSAVAAVVSAWILRSRKKS